MLGLICESRRTTELPHPAALSLVLQFLHLNGSTQSTGFRYDIVTCIRKVHVDENVHVSNVHSCITCYSEFFLTDVLVLM